MDAIVDELLCWGWIDSLPRKLDERRTMVRISPRKPSSRWSRVNKGKVARLDAEGRMRSPGLEAVRVAKANGGWTFLDDVERLEVPDDLAAAFDAEARAFWDRFPASSRRGILEWIKSARTEATRTRRVRETASKAAANRKANFPPGKDRGPAAG